MRSTAIVRNIDVPGRIVIPKEVRDSLSIHANDLLEVFTEGDLILYKKHTVGCIFCDGSGRLKEYKQYKICQACLDEVRLLL